VNSYVNIPIETKTFLELVDFLREVGSDRDPVETVSLAIAYWMDNASWKQDDLLPETIVPEETPSFLWKNKNFTLELPEGTQVRMQYKGVEHYAKVVGSDIIYEGENYTPSQLARKISGHPRNAWRDLFVKRPRESRWSLADDLRSQGLLSRDALNTLFKRGKPDDND